MSEPEKATIAALLGTRLDALERVPGGGNNLVLRARAGARSWLVKAYAPGDGRERLEREWAMLSFLWSEGVRSVPEPIVADHETALAVYGWIDGTKASKVTVEDQRALVELLATMWRLREKPGARALPLAKEATFTARELATSIERRFERLRSGIEPDAIGREALRFLDDDASRALADARARALDLEPDVVLSHEERTLSPSDHGFHNALRAAAGWTFIDFEYAGWDDPAKMLSDAVLQPAVPLPDPRAFLGAMLDALGRGNALVARFRRLYPLWAVKWSLIILNEFSPQARERRRRAAGDPTLDPRQAQLEKARVALERRKNDHLS